MKTKTLRTARKSRVGSFVRLVMAAAIIVAASWYALPHIRDLSSDTQLLNRALVTTDDVNLRNGPSLDHEVILVVPVGTEIASDYVIENGFTRVLVQGKQGWMSASYLEVPRRDAGTRTVNPPVHAGDIVAMPDEAAVVEYPEAISVEQEPTLQPTSSPVYSAISAQSTQVQADPKPGEKWIEVNRTNRTVTLHNGEIIVAQFDGLIGKDLSADGYYSTATGTFHVHVKEKSLVETPFADGVYLTDFVGFDPDRSNGFHSPVRDQHGNVVETGGTSTLGCVRLAEDDAIFLFNFAHIGMRVEVHD